MSRRRKRSNEKLLAEFGRLAEFAVIKFIRSERLSFDIKNDLIQALLVEMFRAPERYRNRRGMSVLIGSRIKDFRRGFLKGSVQPLREITTGLFGTEDDDLGDRDIPNLVHEENVDAFDFSAIFKHLDVLSSSERNVLAMTFGIEGAREFSDPMIAFRLGKPRWWVGMKRKQAIFKLQSVMGLQKTAEGL